MTRRVPNTIERNRTQTKQFKQGFKMSSSIQLLLSAAVWNSEFPLEFERVAMNRTHTLGCKDNSLS